MTWFDVLKFSWQRYENRHESIWLLRTSSSDLTIYAFSQVAWMYCCLEHLPYIHPMSLVGSSALTANQKSVIFYTAALWLRERASAPSIGNHVLIVCDSSIESKPIPHHLMHRDLCCDSWWTFAGRRITLIGPGSSYRLWCSHEKRVMTQTCRAYRQYGIDEVFHQRLPMPAYLCACSQFSLCTHVKNIFRLFLLLKCTEGCQPSLFRSAQTFMGV
jgi:hypothetical protein